MAQEIYQWARNLAVYYIILTALMHIMPDIAGMSARSWGSY